MNNYFFFKLLIRKLSYFYPKKVFSNQHEDENSKKTALKTLPMNLFIYSDLLFSSNEPNTTALLSYSRLLKDSSSRNQFFSTRSLPKRPTPAPRPKPTTVDSANKQTRTYFVDLNKQSAETFTPFTVTPKNSSRVRRPVDSSRCLDTAKPVAEVIEGSRMRIRDKAVDDLPGSVSSQFRLKILNNLKPSPRYETSSQEAHAKSIKPSPLVESRYICNFKKQRKFFFSIFGFRKKPLESFNIRPPTKAGYTSLNKKTPKQNPTTDLFLEASLPTEQFDIDEIEDEAIRDEFRYRVESPHKLDKSTPDDYKFASYSSMNLERHRQRHKFMHEHFELYQSSFFSANQ